MRLPMQHGGEASVPRERAPELKIRGAAASAAQEAKERIDPHEVRAPQHAAPQDTTPDAARDETDDRPREAPGADAAPSANEPRPDRASTALPACFLPPPDPHGDPAWGLGQEVATGADAALTEKLAHFHTLKEQGVHFNATLARNRSFHNPHIYAKLVKWADLDETGSNYVPMAHAAQRPPMWDPKRADMLRDGDVAALGTYTH